MYKPNTHGKADYRIYMNFSRFNMLLTEETETFKGKNMLQIKNIFKYLYH